MEMESSRRPFDRSREPGLKKPRLAEEAIAAPANGRGFAPRPVVSGSGSRFRVGERERDSESSDSVRGPYLQQQHQELVSQYKKALAELTFNSKPIITNLTIIAGENSHAAKAIAAVICTNIIEVPREQKLPSLYLLDSIVKNIGRDYIKYFAARLPEVFCKAYRQVDPSIHSGMRHLFGTWKGVFPPQSLQIIEKELGFGTSVNGSSSGSATVRPDSQAQRPAHSIHVNPKYLEARQRLQQSTRVKGASGNIGGTLSDSPEDSDIPDRTPSISSERPWADPPLKNAQRVHREQLSDPARDKNIITAYGEPDYSFDVSKRSGLGVGRASDKLKDQGFNKPWYDSGSSVTGAISNKRNGFDMKPDYQSYLPHKSLDPLVHPKTDRNSSELSRSWKNAEEEEYMWDDISSRSTDYGTVDSSAKDRWMPDVIEKLDPRKPQPTFDLGSRADIEASAESLPIDRRGQAAFGHRVSPSWSQEPHLPDGTRLVPERNILGHSEGYTTTFSGLSSKSSSMGRSSFQSQIGPVNSKTDVGLGPTGSLGQRKQALGVSIPSVQPPMQQCPPSSGIPNQLVHNLADHDQARPVQRGDPRKSHFSAQTGTGLHKQFSLDSLPISQNSHVVSSQSSRTPNISVSRSPTVPFQAESNSSGQPKPGLPQIPISRNPSPKLSSLSDKSNHHNAESPRELSTSSLLASVMKSGILDSNSIVSSLSEPSSKDAGVVSPLPDGPTPAQYASSGPKNAPISFSSLPTKLSTLQSTTSQGKMDGSPIPPGLPSSLSMPKTISNPVTSLLDSLVAKGLITASKSDSSTVLEAHISSGPKKPSSAISDSVLNSSLPVCTVTPCTSDKIPSVKPDPLASDSLPQSIATDIKSIIGFEFRPHVVREFHPEVISELLDDLPHCCTSCGLRLKLKECLDRHLEWHTLKRSESDDVNKPSRQWYKDSVYWVGETLGSLSGGESVDSPEVSNTEFDCTEPVVPTDENQCACILCGELFEDFFSQETEQWMFKGAAYLSVPPVDNKTGNAGNLVSQSLIVHAACLSETSFHEVGSAQGIKP